MRGRSPPAVARQQRRRGLLVPHVPALLTRRSAVADQGRGASCNPAGASLNFRSWVVKDLALVPAGAVVRTVARLPPFRATALAVADPSRMAGEPPRATDGSRPFRQRRLAVAQRAPRRAPAIGHGGADGCRRGRAAGSRSASTGSIVPTVARRRRDLTGNAPGAVADPPVASSPMPASVRVGVAGATGQVGGVVRALLDQRKFPVAEVRYFARPLRRAHAAVAGRRGRRRGCGDCRRLPPRHRPVLGRRNKPRASPSLHRGRRDRDRQLVRCSGWTRRAARGVEVNPDALDRIPKGIVANPNCTTMAAMPVLMPLHREAGLRRLIASTYQAVSGSGPAGVAEPR